MLTYNSSHHDCIGLIKLHVERITWTLVFLLVGSYLGRDFAHQISDLTSRDIITSISLRDIDKVPFPAILVNTGGAVDPLGYIRQSGNALTEQDFKDDKG